MVSERDSANSLAFWTTEDTDQLHSNMVAFASQVHPPFNPEPSSYQAAFRAFTTDFLEPKLNGETPVITNFLSLIAQRFIRDHMSQCEEEQTPL